MPNLYGNDASNLMKGTAGADELYAGAGNDIAMGNIAGAEFTTGDGSQGNPFANPNMDPSGNDMLEGGSGDDALYAGDGDDTVYGGEGDDGGVALIGVDYFAAGLFGGDGDDKLYGGGGEDDLVGGLGQDHLWGGDDSDRFIFTSANETAKKGKFADVIHDFSRKQDDIIDLSAIDAKKGGGDNDFKYIGDDDFSGKKGELRYEKGKLQGDTNGDGKADFTIKLGVAKLGNVDFDL